MTRRFRHAGAALALLALLVAQPMGAQPARRAIAANPNLAGSNYLAYRGPQRALTAAPEGYTPYYISHYGRHGSRYLIGADAYDKPYLALRRADSLGQLTATGRDVLARVGRLRREALLRDGELTPLGAQQHRDIARRLYERFPEVLAGEATVDARSTVVIRCILSMESALQQLAALNPRLTLRHDASQHDMYYMNNPHSPYDSLRRTPEAAAALRAFDARHTDYAHLVRTFFADTAALSRAEAHALGNQLIKLAANVQSTELRRDMALWPLFTPDEIYNYWLRTNAFWYMYYGPSRETAGAGMYMQANLLRNIIATADSCLRLPHPGATLRYGHEANVMPLVCLMDLDGYGQTIPSLDSLAARGWINYNIYPMACNVQLVFYKPTAVAVPATDDILVKVLLNEDEARLPLPTNRAPYYRWRDVRAHYLHQLEGK